MQKVIVTGGAGFIGSTLVDKLIEQGIKVTILDNLSTGKQKNINPKATFIKCDLAKPISHHSNLAGDGHVFEGVDTVFHLAALPQVQYSIENPTDNNNLISTINVLEAAKQSNVKRVIFSSTCALYGNPKYTPIDENHPIETLTFILKRVLYNVRVISWNQLLHTNLMGPILILLHSTLML